MYDTTGFAHNSQASVQCPYNTAQVAKTAVQQRLSKTSKTKSLLD